jgi:DNA-binding NtrC family response regulator
MKNDFRALLVSPEPEQLNGLEKELQLHSVRTHQVRSCTEARAFIRRQGNPDIIFTDASLPDGTWADVLRMARKEQPSAEVVIASRLPDIKLYLDFMESGGFDFIAVPFSQTEVAHILENASVEASKRWGAQLRAAVSRSTSNVLRLSARAGQA